MQEFDSPVVTRNHFEKKVSEILFSNIFTKKKLNRVQMRQFWIT